MDHRKFICDVISEMLDNPDEHGIYPTTRAFDRLEKYCELLEDSVVIHSTKPQDPWDEAASRMAAEIADEIDAEIIANIKELAPVDPEWESLYGQLTNNGVTRSNAMSDDFLLDDDEFDLDVDDVEETGLTVEDFLVRLETFLEAEFDEDARGNVFLSDNGDNGVVLNILVGASFQETDSEINQVNIILNISDITQLIDSVATSHASTGVWPDIELFDGSRSNSNVSCTTL